MDDEFGRGKRSAKKRTFYGDDEDDEKNSSTSEETSGFKPPMTTGTGCVEQSVLYIPYILFWCL